MMYELVLLEKEGADGLNKKEIISLFDMLNAKTAYPIEIPAHFVESSAMGFITPDAADKIDYDYETSGLCDFIADILDDMNNETDTHEYEFKGIKIYLNR